MDIGSNAGLEVRQSLTNKTNFTFKNNVSDIKWSSESEAQLQLATFA